MIQAASGTRHSLHARFRGDVTAKSVYSRQMEIPGYRIQRMIGQGGMATAYLAEQVSLGRQVVLKVLKPDAAAKAEARERFINEGRLIAAVNHPNIITIYDVGQLDDSVYLAMEYVGGGDLRQRLEHRTFAPEEALDVLTRIASGLDVAHRKGIVHRDVKPANILFRDQATPLLTDFGIAKQLQSDADLTRTGIFLGSPNYMAPEQAEAGPVDGRADLYALGCIFFEMVTGRKPFPADNVVDVLWMHKKSPIPVLPPEHVRYQEMLSLMLAKHRNDRFRDMDSFLHYVDNLRRRPSQLPPAEELDQTVRLADFERARGAASAPSPGARASWGPRRIRVGLRQLLLGVGLVLSGGFFTAVLLLDLRLDNDGPVPPLADLPPVNELPKADSAAPIRVDDVDGPTRDEVEAALIWLGQHALDEFRLTAPEGDNAWHYFTRLSRLSPDHPAIAAGYREMGTRFAWLAERALASGDAALAVRYVEVGLQVDPGNPALAELRGIMPREGRSGGLLPGLRGR